MKNISRRVFIKGMAVAAVATAASTVLTGCKLPVDPNEPVTDPTFNPVTNTLTLGDESVKVTVTGYGIKPNGDVVVDMTVVNNTNGQKVTLKTGTPSPAVDGDMYINGYIDGQTFKKANLTLDTAKDEVDANDSKTGKDYVLDTQFTLSGLGSEWESVDVVFTLYLADDKGTNQSAEVTVTLNK